MQRKPPAFLSTQVSSSRRFYFRIPNRPSSKFLVFCGGFESSTPEYVVDRKTFPYLAVELVVAGKGMLTLDGHKSALEPGIVFTYGPNIPHRFYSSPDDPLVKYFVDLSGSEAEELLHKLKMQPGSLFSVEALAEVHDLFETLVVEGTGERRHSREICALLCRALLWKISENRIPRGEKISERYLTYLRCRETLTRDYLKMGNLGDFALRCGITSAYLCRLYRRYDHQTPYHHLQRLRMLHAANLLGKPGILIKDVAEILKIPDVYHFSRMFKRIHGISPRAHRNMALRTS